MSKDQNKESFPDRFDAFFESMFKKYPAVFTFAFISILYVFMVAHCSFLGYVGGAK